MEVRRMQRVTGSTVMTFCARDSEWYRGYDYYRYRCSRLRLPPYCCCPVAGKASRGGCVILMAYLDDARRRVTTVTVAP